MKKNNSQVVILSSAKIPTKFGEFEFGVWKSVADNKEHIFLKTGKIKTNETLLVRIHSACITSECFLSLKCDCREQLHQSMEAIQQESGLIIYLNQEGRDIGLVNKIKAYTLQSNGLDTVQANESLGLDSDQRNYQTAIDLLNHFSIKKVKLMTNNPLKIVALEAAGFSVIRISLASPVRKENKKYLLTKKNKLGHLFKDNI
ncbi:GTP cyclohydrolase II [bacterium]|nr:GTP cyclohydrolase II [bacterium]